MSCNVGDVLVLKKMERVGHAKPDMWLEKETWDVEMMHAYFFLDIFLF